MKMDRTHFEEFQAAYSEAGFNCVEFYGWCRKTIPAVRRTPRYKEARPWVETDQVNLTTDEAIAFLENGPPNKFTQFFRSLKASGNTADEMTTFREWLAMYNFWASGCRVFQVMTDLSRMLVETDLKVERRFLKLPFPAIFLSWRGLDLTITCHSDQTRWPLAGCYVHEITEPDHDGKVKKFWRFFFVTEENVERGGNVLFSSLPISDVMQKCEDGTYKPVLTDPTGLVTDQSILDVVTERPNFADEYEHNVKEEEMSRFMSEMPPLVRLAVNTVLYINAPGADLRDVKPDNRDLDAQIERTKKPKKRRRLQSEKDKRSSLPWVRVGARVKAPAGAEAQQTEDGGIRRLSYRFTVRGHWRTYWKTEAAMDETEWARCDREHTRESKNKRKLYSIMKWIAPFEKGPEMAEVVTKRYAVE